MNDSQTILLCTLVLLYRLGAIMLVTICVRTVTMQVAVIPNNGISNRFIVILKSAPTAKMCLTYLIFFSHKIQIFRATPINENNSLHINILRSKIAPD